MASLAVVALVGMATAYLWGKVETGSLAEAISRTRGRLEALAEERSRLLAQVARQTLPAHIERLAHGELGMVYPASVAQLETGLGGASD